MTGNTNPNTRLLIVEDNPVDLRLLQYALHQEETWKLDTQIADDGEKAITMLLASSVETSRPDFIILDLNLPKRDGAEVLHVIRNEERLQRMPVAILSSSPMDVIKGKMARANVRANCYFTKPMNIDEFIALGHQLHVCYRQVREQLEMGNLAYEIEPAVNGH